MTTTPTRALAVSMLLAAVLAIAGCAKEDPAAFIESAKSYLAKSDPRAATVQLKNALQSAPDTAEARFLLATSLLNSGDAIAAETEVRKAIDLKYPADQAYPLLARSLVAQRKFDAVIKEVGDMKPANPQAAADLATSLAIAELARGNATAASSAIDSALALAPKDARAMLVKAQIVAQNNDPAATMAIIDAALALSPRDLDAMLAKAQLLGSTDRRAEAIKLLEQAIEAHPAARQPQLALIAQLVATRQFDAAKTRVEALRKIAPNELGTTYSEALVSFATGDATAARDHIQKVLAAQPEHLPSLYLSGLIDAELKFFSSAEETLRKVVARAPDDPGPRHALALAYLSDRQPALAMQTIEPALRKTPEDPELLRLAAEASIATGAVATGAKYFERAAAVDKTGVTSKVRLAQVRLATGDTDRAFRDLESLAKSDASQDQADIALVLAHLQRREYDKALAAVDALEKKQPRSAVVPNLRGAVYMAKRDLKSARSSFEASLEANPNDLAAAYNLAIIDVQEGRADDAVKRYERMLASDPKNETILLGLADLTALTKPNPADTRALIDRAIAANPRSVRARLALIGFHVRQQDARGALAAAQSAQNAFPDDFQVLESLGVAQLSAGENNAALETFKRAAKLQPNNALVLARVATLQLHAKDYASAADSARKALAVQPDQPAAWTVLIRALTLSGQAGGALAEARKMQKEQPSRAIGYALEGEILGGEKKWMEAAAAFRQGLAKEPLPMLAVGTYHALQSAGKSAEAAAFAGRWNREHPRDTMMSEYLAQQDVLKKDYAAASAKYRAILTVDPDHTVALNNLAWILGENGDPTARDYAERAYRLAPHSAAVIDTLGWTLYRTGEVERGTQLLRLASNLAPGDKDIRLHLGTALAKRGEKEDARRVLEPLTRLAEGTPQRVEAEKLLAGK